MESKYILTVEELINYLKTLPKETIVCDADSGNDGVRVRFFSPDNYLIITGEW